MIKKFGFEDGQFHVWLDGLAEIAFVLDVALEDLVLEVVVYCDVRFVLVEGELIGKGF